MPVNALRFIRKMRGGAQAHLIECDDGNFYVVKFRNNPQHRRILVNEWVSSVFLKYLRISAPECAAVSLSADFIAANPETSIQLGSHRVPPEPGWHFGSRYPGDPARVSVYDFLPDVLLGKLANAREFLAIFAFDKWMGNADSRQAIFLRARLRQFPPGGDEDPAPRTGFLALMVDHGYVFDGPHWTFADSPLQGLYFRPSVYQSVRSPGDFEPWLDRIVNFPEEVIDDAVKQMPPEWNRGDEDELEKLLLRLLRRRKRVPDLLHEAATGGRVNAFPNWKRR